MKFGKQLQARISKLRSRECFFKYKRLKQWIRRHRRDLNSAPPAQANVAAPATAAPNATSSSSSPSSSAPNTSPPLKRRGSLSGLAGISEADGHKTADPFALSGREARAKFVKALRPERGRVLNYFRRQIRSLQVRWKGACEAIEAAVSEGSLAGSETGSNAFPEPPTELVKEVMGPSLTQSMSPTTAANAAPAPAAAPPLPDPLPSTCRDAVFACAQQADRLSSYAKLNLLALQKICKKFNKRLAWAAHEADLGSILDDEWVASFHATLEERIERLEILRDEMRSTVERFMLLPPAQEEATEEATIEDVVAEDEVLTVTELVIDALPVEEISSLRLELSKDGMGDPIAVPVIVARGKYEGPVLGITSALHGNELNGIPLIADLFQALDVTQLCGTLVAIPVLNPEGYIRNQRGFLDGQDLNRLFPGKANGNCGQVYSYNIMQKLICHFTHLIDLHTASFGRVNSLYVRADMNHPVSRQMALHQHPQIIVHNTAPDGSMRSAAQAAGVAAITVEIGNPQRFHAEFIQAAQDGIDNILSFLRMYGAYSAPELPPLPAVVCGHSYWIYTNRGGVLHMLVNVNTWVEKGEPIARLDDLFGNTLQLYKAPETGIVVGCNKNPVAATGDRLVHLGIASDSFPAKADDGHA